MWEEAAASPDHSRIFIVCNLEDRGHMLASALRRWPYMRHMLAQVAPKSRESPRQSNSSQEARCE